MFLILVSDWFFHCPLVKCLKIDHDWLCLISLLSSCTHPICSHSFHWGVSYIHDILRIGSAFFFFLLDVFLKCDCCCCYCCCYYCFCWVWQQFEWNWIVVEYSSSRWFWFCIKLSEGRETLTMQWQQNYRSEGFSRLDSQNIIFKSVSNVR
jgi:hypothetical protein